MEALQRQSLLVHRRVVTQRACGEREAKQRAAGNARTHWRCCWSPRQSVRLSCVPDAHSDGR